jgi:hypothetical protein
MEEAYLLTTEEKEEASLIRDEMLGVLSGNPSISAPSKISSLETAYRTHNIEKLRLYRRFLANFRSFDIDRAAAAKLHLGYPAESVDGNCMKLVARFQEALVRNRPESVHAIDSQTMTILLRHVVANPEDLEMVIRIILERRARGYKDVLEMLADMKSQSVSAPIQDGLL